MHCQLLVSPLPCRFFIVDEIHLFITGDFIGAWVGRQAMNLLEFASRLCTNDSTGNALKDFSKELFKIELKFLFFMCH